MKHPLMLWSGRYYLYILFLCAKYFVVYWQNMHKMRYAETKYRDRTESLTQNSASLYTQINTVNTPYVLDLINSLLYCTLNHSKVNSSQNSNESMFIKNGSMLFFWIKWACFLHALACWVYVLSLNQKWLKRGHTKSKTTW